MVPALKREVDLRGVTPWDSVNWGGHIPDSAITIQYLEGAEGLALLDNYLMAQCRLEDMQISRKIALAPDNQKAMLKALEITTKFMEETGHIFHFFAKTVHHLWMTGSAVIIKKRMAHCRALIDSQKATVASE